MSARVLLAEDDRFLRKAAEAMLRRQGFVVRVAVDGEEALEAVQQECPDLVLLDLIMPTMQGFQVLESLKADPETAHVPVIVLSNLGQDADVARAMAGGAAAYFIKSNTSLANLVEQVRTVLAQRAA
jgi:twitching motility two-component system response regulator PilH